jgi:hypothetical protein
MEIVTRKNAFWGTLIIPQNKRFTVPDGIGTGLVARGMAEQISPEIVEEFKKKKGK